MQAVNGEDAEDEVVQREDSRFGTAHGIALILLAAAMALAPAARVQYGFRGFIAIYVLSIALWLMLRRVSASLTVTLVIGLALRVMFLFAEPALSGDVYRYLSDGRQLISGHNPYTYTPEDPRIDHREIRSIYPPLAQLLFALSGGTMFGWKLILILGDLGVIVVMRGYGVPTGPPASSPAGTGASRSRRRRDAAGPAGGTPAVPQSAAFAFATCPLVIFEGAWNGHIDALAAVFLALALLKRSGLAAGIAAGLKVIPLAAVPALFPKRCPTSLYLALLVPFLFFLSGPIMPGFRDYATRWIFNSPLYALIRALVERIPTKTIWTHHPLRFEAISDLVYRHLHPDFVTRAILATLAIGGILLARRATTAVAALLLCSPAIHPWYWLTLVPTALMEGEGGPPASRRLGRRRLGAEGGRWTRVALTFALCAPFSYLLYDEASPLLVYALCYSIPLARLWRE